MGQPGNGPAFSILNIHTKMRVYDDAFQIKLAYTLSQLETPSEHNKDCEI